VNVVYRRLSKGQFASAHEFQAAYLQTPLQVATFSFFDPSTG
jgi:hypothetical protein